MVHSGLRGAVSLTLAIIVDLDPATSKQMGTRVMFHVGGIAALTFIINATTAAPLLRLLGLTKNSQMKERMLKQLSESVTNAATELFDQEVDNKTDLRFDGANPEIVRAMVPSLNNLEFTNADLSMYTRSPAEFKVAMTQELREVFLRHVQNNYWEAINDGVIPKSMKVARILLHSVDAAMANASEPLTDWQRVAEDADMKRWTKPSQFESSLSHLVDCRPLSWFPWLRRSCAIEFKILETVWLSLSFQEAHTRARADVPKYFNAKTPVEEEVQELVLKESEEQCSLAAQALENVQPASLELGKSEMLARRVLTMQIEKVSHLHEKNIISEAEASHLQHTVKDALRALTFSPKGVWRNARAAEGRARFETAY